MPIQVNVDASGGFAVLTVEAVAFGVGRMVELKAQAAAPSLLVRVFRDYDRAARWLRRP